MKSSLSFLARMACNLSVFVSLTIILCATSLFAEERSASLEEIVVTATKVEEPKKDVPASVQIITQEDIKNSTAKDAGDLIAEAGIGHVHKYPGASTGRIAIRGLAGDAHDDPFKNKILILVNGSFAGTSNLALILVDDIERIEILKGPASVLYGTQAMGGVINIITKQGREGIHGSIGGEIGSWSYWNTKAELSGKKDRFDFYLLAGRSAKGDYKAKVKDKNGNDYGKNTAYDDETASIRLGYKPFDNHHISIGFQHWKGWDIGSPNASYSPDYDDKMDKERNSFDIGYKWTDFNAKYYFVKNKSEYHTVTSGVITNTTTSEKDSQGINLQKSFPIGDHRIIIGGQWDRIEVESSRTAGSPYNPNSQYDTYGLFTEGRLSLLDKKLLLSAGLRYDYFENRILATAGIPSVKPRKEDLDHVSVRGGLVYKLTDAISLKGNIGTAFRAPAPDELATDYVSSWGTRYIGNPNLKPEKSTSYDAGVEYSKDLLKGGLTFFHTDFKDKILSYYDTSLSAQTFKNVDGATLQGIEANLSYDIGLASGLDLSIEPFTNITYHTRYSSKDNLEISKSGKTLLYIPKWTGAFGIRTGKEKWDLRLIANYTGDEKVQDWAPPSNGKNIVKKSDFTVMNIKGSYKPVKNLEITASIENLFDRAYEYVLGYPMPARTFVAGVKWVF
ncbi:MAG: TonB-dependent receptor [Nitrospiraceae bacterium]|nr:TonB-dependent receptor [Nitrospiraceae bacterium]